MNKKGYTLIELLAVLSIMAVILLIAVPAITKQMSQIEDGKYNQFKQNLYLASESYINSNYDEFEILRKENGEACINVEYLVRDGWIKSTLKNPKTDKNVSLDSSIQISNVNGEYKYTYRPKSVCDN